MYINIYIYIHTYIYTGKPPPGSRNQWFIYQLVNGSILCCWLQVAGDQVTCWLQGYWLPVYWISFDSPTKFAESDEVSRFCEQASTHGSRSSLNSNCGSFFGGDVMWLVVCVWSHVIGGLVACCLLPIYQLVVSYWWSGQKLVTGHWINPYGT